MTETTMRDAVSRFFCKMREGGRRQGNVLFALIFKKLKPREGDTGYHVNRRKVLER